MVRWHIKELRVRIKDSQASDEWIKEVPGCDLTSRDVTSRRRTYTGLDESIR
jgi:hypothetical protein